MIVESAVKPTKAGTGKYLQLDWQILEGEYKNRSPLWDRLNIQNPNAVAQKIGQETLSAICLPHSARRHDLPPPTDAPAAADPAVVSSPRSCRRRP
jgi:hypothetical protein